MEVDLKWSEYRNGRWMGAVASKDKLTYTTNSGVRSHYFTGWVGEDGVLRISVRINMLYIEGVDARRSAEGYIGYFYFDACGGALVGTSVEITDPAGDVLVWNGLPYYNATGLFSGAGLLELDIGAAPEERQLITTAQGQLVYAHQDGLYGKETSPFFFSDGVRTYFVQLMPDMLQPRLDDLGLTAAGRRGQNQVATASTPRGARSQRAAATSALATTATQYHYEASDSTLIMNRDGVDRFTSSSSLFNMIGTVIAEDPAQEFFATAGAITWTTLRYRFTRFYHPHTCLFLKQQSRYGIDGLLNPDPAWGADSAELYRQLLPSNSFDFEANYQPNPTWVDDNFSSEQVGEQIDFDHWSPYGCYNWEQFFHIPLLIATRLMQNQRYADARRWFHYIFDPTATDGAGPERFWKIKPFFEEQLNGPLASLEALLTEGNVSYEQQVEEWELDPFNVHVIARLRISAYMQATVMRYMTCLIKEADMLFRSDTREDINEARQLYLLAAAILGDRPYVLPAQEAVSLTPNLLLERFRFDWNNGNGPLGHNPLDLLTSFLSADRPGAPAARSSARVASGGIVVDTAVQDGFSSATTLAAGVPAQGGTSSVDTLLLFGIPHNEMLYGFWDTVADRLFKIRHSMNLSGQVRQLALFAPPIDPALLVRASASGLSIAAILSGLFAPRSNYRFSFMLQKALELCGEARSLGGALLAALVNQDGEQVALLRSTHEVGLLESMRALKKKSVEEAESSLAGLVKSREAAEFRGAFYSSLERVSAGEQKSLDKQEEAAKTQRDADAASALSSILYQVPNITVTAGVPPPSVGTQFGGVNLGGGAQAVSSVLRARSAMRGYEASKAGTMGGHTRRFKDWKLQADLARKEVEQLDQQILAAEIRKQIADTDRDNHEKQVAQAQEVEDFLKLKFSNQQLYSWMVSKLASVHFQAYQMAYQIAKQAEAAFLQELGPDEQGMSFIKPDNWDSLKKGLVAGELLNLQLRQMEAAHLAANKRELEITKPISLFRLDPEALLALRETGTCEFHLPEALFDMDFAGHYYRRIKAIRVTIPCVVGPYANVSATLSLLGSWTRRSTDLTDPEQPVQDTVASPQSAIAASSAIQDGGVFELNFNDPRYLPFEGAGAISTWTLKLPWAIRPFDYATISDVVLHVSYTAHDGGLEFEASINAGLPAALNNLTPLIAQDATMSRLFSLRQEFPTAWNLLVNASGGLTRTCTLQLSKQHFPSFLAYAWKTLEDETTEIIPITLEVKSLSAHLSPRGPVPTDAGDIKLNEQPAKPVTDWSIPTFDLTNALTSALTSALSSTSIGNIDVITCELTIDGTFRAEDWNDLYLLMDYKVGV